MNVGDYYILCYLCFVIKLTFNGLVGHLYKDFKEDRGSWIHVNSNFQLQN